MDNKYSFNSINYSGITDVPSLVIQSNDLIIYNVNTSSALMPTDNVLFPMQRTSGNVTLEDVNGNLVYKNGNYHYISVDGNTRRLFQDSNINWYYTDSQDQTVYLLDKYGEKITSIYDDLSKHEINASFTMTSQDGNTTLFETTGTIGIQGNSSVSTTAIVKKSFKLKFKDNVTIGQWAEQDSFSIKAYFADWTNCRDIVCLKVYEQMLILNGTRPNGDPVSDTSALCHIDGFPVRVYFIDKNSNRQYWGLYVFQNRKKRKTFGMSKKDLSQIAFEGNSNALTMARELINPDDTRANYDILKDTLTTFSETVKLRTKDDESRDSILRIFNLNSYLDTYLLFFLFFNWDSYGHNTIYATWNASAESSYYVLPYDMDLTFGAKYISGENGLNTFEDPSAAINDALSKSYPLIYSFIGKSSSGYSNTDYFYTLAKNRYKQLRDEEIFSVNNIIGLCKKLFFQTTGLPNAEALYAAHPEYLGMTGGEIDSSDEQTVDTLYQDTNYRDFYYEDKIRWNWYKVYVSSSYPNLSCGGVCNKYGGRESISRMQDWITARIARGDILFQYEPSEQETGVRNMNFNSSIIENMNFNYSQVLTVKYNDTVVYDASGDIQTIFELYPEVVQTNSIFEPTINRLDDSYTIPNLTMSGNTNFFIRTKKVNTGNINITNNSENTEFIYQIDNYGYGYLKLKEYNGWQGGTTNKYSTTVTLTPANDPTLKKTIYCANTTDEDNTVFHRGLLLAKLIRIPYSGISDNLKMYFFPFNFDSNYLYGNIYCAKIDCSNVGETTQGGSIIRNATYVSHTPDTIVNDVFLNTLYPSRDNAYRVNLAFSAGENGTGNYRYAFVSFNIGTAYSSTSTTLNGVQVHFIQEPYSENRIYYGKVPNEPRLWDSYAASGTSSLRYHYIFQIANSEIITNSKDIYAKHFEGTSVFNVLCVPRMAGHTYTITANTNSTYTKLTGDNEDYLWGNQIYDIYRLNAESDTTYNIQKT